MPTATVADSKVKWFQEALGVTTTNITDLERSFYSANSGLTPAEKYSLSDHKRAFFYKELGLSSVIFSISDVETSWWDSYATQSIYTSKVGKEYNFFTNQSFDPISGLTGLAAYYRADKISEQILVSDGFDRSRNLMSVAAASFDASAGGWVNSTNSTVSFTTAKSYVGAGSLTVTASATSSLSRVRSNVTSIPATPGTTYTASLYALSDVAGRSVSVAIGFYTSASAFINTWGTGNPLPGTTVTTSTTQWQRSIVSATAPSDAAYVVIFFLANTVTAGDVFYVDAAQIEVGSTATKFTYGDATNLGVADTGQAWSTVAGVTAGVSSGIAKIAATATPFVAHIDAGSQDVDISATVTNTVNSAGGIGLVARFIDNSNYIVGFVVPSTGGLTIRRVVAGTATDSSFPGTVFNGTRVFNLKLIGTAVTLTDGVTTANLSLTNAELAALTGTKVGFRDGNGANSTTWDNFTVKVPALTDGTAIGCWPDLSGNNRHAFQNTYTPPNLLTQNQATVETDLTGLSGHGPATIARSTVWAAEGSASVLVTPQTVPANGDGAWTSTTVPVTVGLSYTNVVTIKNNSSMPVDFRVWLKWRQGANVFLTDTASGPTSIASGATAVLSITGTAPANATSLGLAATITDTNRPLTGETFAVDQLGIFQSATVPTWRAPNEPSGFLSRPLFRKTARNLLTYNQATIETDTTGLAARYGSCTIARSITRAAHGSASLEATKITSIGTIFISTSQGTSGIPVVPGKTYTAIASSRAITTAQLAYVRIGWHDAAGAELSTPAGAAVTNSTTLWTTHTLTAIAPANAAFACVQPSISNAAIGEVHAFDQIGLFEGTVTSWVPPVTIPNSKAAIQFDGLDDLLSSAQFARTPDATLIAVVAADVSGAGLTNQRAFYWRTTNGVWLGLGDTSTREANARDNDGTFPGASANIGSVTTLMVQTGEFPNAGPPKVYLDGTLRATSGTNYDFFAENASLWLGSSGGAGTFLKGRIVAAVLFDRVLTTAERNKVEKFLGSRYGITVAA